ncbi:MAG: sigma-70 family RNA polymerase sigma factor [Clostridiales bacterium]|nr:sigma-70 family RNA polymerase sigma factor [Clostridiales bacterium]
MIKTMKSANEITEYLKRLKNGERCLEKFFSAASGYIKFVAYYYLVDKSFVDDVVNSTLFKIFDNIQNFDENQSGKAWISKIAQNEAYTINNRERKHNHASLDEVRDEVACTTDDFKRSEFMASVENSLSELDETDRQIVVFRLINDMTFEEIASELNMYVGTVYKRFKRSVRKINEDIS